MARPWRVQLTACQLYTAASEGREPGSPPAAAAWRRGWGRAPSQTCARPLAQFQLRAEALRGHVRPQGDPHSLPMPSPCRTESDTVWATRRGGGC